MNNCKTITTAAKRVMVCVSARRPIVLELHERVRGRELVGDVYVLLAQWRLSVMKGLFDCHMDETLFYLFSFSALLGLTCTR